MALFKKKALSSAETERLQIKATQLQIQGEECRKNRDLVGALKYYEKALNVLNQINDSIALGRVLQGKGMIHRDLKQFKQAEKCLFQALEIFQSIYDFKRQGTTYDRLGTLYYMMNDHRRSIEMYLKAGQILAECNEFEDAILAITAGASLEIESGNSKQAEDRLEQALQWVKDNNISHEEPHVLHVLSLALLKQGRNDQAIPLLTRVILLEEHMKKVAYAPSAQKILKELGAEVDTQTKVPESDPQVAAAMAFFHNGQVQAAISQLNVLLSTSEQTGNIEQAAGVSEALGIIQQNIGEIQAAQNAYEKALALYRTCGRKDAIGRVTMLIGILKQDQELFDL